MATNLRAFRDDSEKAQRDREADQEDRARRKRLEAQRKAAQEAKRIAEEKKKLAEQKKQLEAIRKGVQEANMKDQENAPSPLDETQYAKMQELANSNPQLSVKELVAKSDEFIGTDPTTMKNYLVNAGVNLEADTIGSVDLVKAKDVEEIKENEAPF